MNICLKVFLFNMAFFTCQNARELKFLFLPALYSMIAMRLVFQDPLLPLLGTYLVTHTSSES